MIPKIASCPLLLEIVSLLRHGYFMQDFRNDAFIFSLGSCELAHLMTTEF